MQKVKLPSDQNEKMLFSNCIKYATCDVHVGVRVCLVCVGWGGATTLQALVVALYWSLSWPGHKDRG